MEPQIKLDSREVDAYLERMQRRLGTLKPFFDVVWPILHRSILANFRAGGRPVKWKPLSSFTIRERKRKGTWRTGVGSDQPILQETGALRQSIGSVFHISPTELEYGTNYKTATIHQFGATVPLGGGRKGGARRGEIESRPTRMVKIPARPFMLFQPEDVETITAYAAAFAFGTPQG